MFSHIVNIEDLSIFHLQFPVECSLPWMLVEYVLESQNAGLFESILMPFDIYNDSAQHALVTLKQRFLYDEIEAEVIAFSAEIGLFVFNKVG